MYLVLYALNDIDEFAESLCWSLAACVTCTKMTNFLLRENDIMRMLSVLNEDFLKIRDNNEQLMQDKSDFIASFADFGDDCFKHTVLCRPPQTLLPTFTGSGRNTKYFFIITSATVVAMIFGGLAMGKDNITLPLKASFPYDHNQNLAFSLTYFSQSVSLYSAGLISAASETFVMTMLIQICSQLDIICYRLQNLSDFHLNNKAKIYTGTKEANIIKDCVIHHNYIYSLSTKNEFNDKVVVQSIVLTNVLFQIFLYCHFGNAVMLKVGTGNISSR
ncbi:uncharacterized protein LOC122512551 [Leptopilina heterotoma]|uniref:uncharacterized protein LOC122512551 n=1 Tax=Leptopilina heterotoma TaxID=63436 RepID=UPI001CA9E653|nr:uncharacterized protein LOC122512551 [Leptopilina heterotoma]